MSKQSKPASADTPRNEEDLQQLRRLVHIYVEAPHRKATPEWDAHDEVIWNIGETARDNPEICWRLVKTACDEPLTDEELSYVSAGLFEELMSAHGEDFIDRVEVFARQHAKMRFLVATVWKGGMTQRVWDRVLTLRQRLGIEPL